MKAYAIFDGGGVLGAALAGCLAAAEEQSIQFVGFGGTSAGSIVATLAAAGYSGREIEQILVETEFVELLDDGGRPVQEFKDRVVSVLDDLQAGRITRAARALLRLRGLVDAIGPDLGVDDGEALKRFLARRIGERVPALKGHANITFGNLHDHGCRPLKVVASDVTKRRPVVFGRGRDGYGDSVLDAVRASTCYPFVFKPFNMNGRRLVDGGLASNLPAFLFHDEYEQTGHPVFAFDLTAEDAAPPESLGLRDYLQAIVSTALDAGDELMRVALRDVIHVPVPIPAEYDVLDFGISRKGRRDLFNIGYRGASGQLHDFEPLKIVQSAAGQLQRQLQSRYGNPMFYVPVLAALAREIEAETAARGVRAYIMLPTGRETRIVVYSYGMEVGRGDGTRDFSTDHDLEIAVAAGCSGRSWTERSPAVADLVEAARDPAPWLMSRGEHAKVLPDRKSMLSVPILAWTGEDLDDAALPVVGTLSIDSSTPLADTHWIGGDAIHSDVLTRVMTWENIVRRLLRKRHP